MTAHEDEPAPLRVGLSLSALVAEYLDHGRLRSTAAFGFDPDQGADRVLAGGFRPCRMRPQAYRQIERDVLLRHRGGWLPAKIESTYLHERYLGSGFGLYPGPPMATILRWLDARGPATRVELFEFCDVESGRILVDDHLCFNFSRLRGRYRVTSFSPSITFENAGGEYVPDDLNFARHLRDATPCDSLAQWRAKAGKARKGAPRREALRAVEKIAAWLRQP